MESQKQKTHRLNDGFFSGGAGRNRTADRAFAELGLTTWRPRRYQREAEVVKNLAVAQVPKPFSAPESLDYAVEGEGLSPGLVEGA